MLADEVNGDDIKSPPTLDLRKSRAALRRAFLFSFSWRMFRKFVSNEMAAAALLPSPPPKLSRVGGERQLLGLLLPLRDRPPPVQP
jgi:hypothetical protein